jgi:hypothetical protein
MDVMRLLRRAQEVGLRVEPIGDKLLVRGTKRAEAVVELLAAHKAELLAVLAPASTSKCTDQDAAVAATEAGRWRDRLSTRVVEWFHGDRGWEEARWLAWGDVENEWHELHGRRWPSWQCAGCNAPLRTLRTITESQFVIMRRSDSGVGDSGALRMGVGRSHDRRGGHLATMGSGRLEAR